MKPAPWIVVAVAAMLAAVAWRFARRSKLARADAARMRPRDIALLLCGIVSALFSIVFLATAHGEDRIAAATILLFSIALLIVPISGRVAARSGTGSRLARVGGEPALVIPGSKAKLQLMRLACLCFAAMGLLMAIWPHALATNRHSPGSVQIVGIACAVLFGLVGIPSMLLARGPSRIELLPGGLRWQLGAKPSFAEWDAISAVRAFPIRNSWFLGIDARPDGLHVPKSQRWLAAVNRRISSADASISLEAFPVEPQRLAEVVAAYATDAGRRREIGTDASLRRLEGDVPEPEPAAVA